MNPTTTRTYRSERDNLLESIEAQEACVAALLPIGAMYRPGTAARDQADGQYEAAAALLRELRRTLTNLDG
jgi:hypothetical protein